MCALEIESTRRKFQTPKTPFPSVRIMRCSGYPTPKRCSFQSVHLARTGAALRRWLLAGVVVLGRQDLCSRWLLAGCCASGSSSWLAHWRLLFLCRGADALLGDVKSRVLLVFAGHLIAAALLAASSWLPGGGGLCRGGSSLGSSWLSGCSGGGWCGTRLACGRRGGSRGSCGRLLRCGGFWSSSGGRWLGSWCRRSSRCEKFNKRHLALRGWHAIDASLKARTERLALRFTHCSQLLCAILDLKALAVSIEASEGDPHAPTQDLQSWLPSPAQRP